MNEEFPFPLYLFPVLFPVLWCFILFVLSRISGWSRVSKIFAYDGKIDGKYMRFQSARISGVRFGSSLEVGVNEVGLLIVPFLPFRPFHKRLLIPWNYLKAEKFKKFLFTGYKLTLEEDDKFSITINGRLFSRMSDKFALNKEPLNLTS